MYVLIGVSYTIYCMTLIFITSPIQIKIKYLCIIQLYVYMYALFVLLVYIIYYGQK